MKRRALFFSATEAVISGASAFVSRFSALFYAFLISWGLTFSAVSTAAANCEQDCVEVGSWRVNVGLGLGMRSNPLHGGDDTPLILLPEVSYYGERFFLKNFEMGFTLFEDDRHQFNVLVTPGYDQMYFNRWDPFNFTDKGGFTSSGGFTGPPPMAAANYRVNISSRPPSMGSSGALPADPGSRPSGVSVPQARSIVINDQAISLQHGQPQMLFGSEGNPITVEVVQGVVNIAGVVAGDRILLSGVEALDTESIEGQGNADVKFAGSDPNANTWLINLGEGNQYVITATGPESAAEERQKIEVQHVASRKMAGLAGFEYSYVWTHLSLHLQALADFTDVHNGQELRAALVFPWYAGEQKWALTLGANYKSREILDYYYGLSGRDTNNPAYFFEPESAGVERMVRLDWQRPVTEKWSLRAMLQYSLLPNSIHNSPLAADDQVGSVFVGGVYHF